MMSIFDLSGNACQRQAMSPAMFGFENEVPFPADGLPLGGANTVPAPTDTIFGFLLPAPFGPRLLNEAMFPFTSVAPTATTLSPSAGTRTYLLWSVCVP